MVDHKRTRPAVTRDPEAKREKKNKLQRGRKAREGCLFKNLMQGSELLPNDDKKGIQRPTHVLENQN